VPPFKQGFGMQTSPVEAGDKKKDYKNTCKYIYI
jgi:hypothetical protein